MLLAEGGVNKELWKELQWPFAEENRICLGQALGVRGDSEGLRPCWRRSGQKEPTHQADEFWCYGVREDFFPRKGKTIAHF